MSRGTTFAILAGLLSTGLLAVQSARLVKANDRLSTASTRHQAVVSQVQHYESLAQQSQTRLFGAPPDTDIQASVSRVLRAAGLAEQTATSVRREADRAASAANANTGVRVREVRVEFASISPAQLGLLLRIWREQEPAWRVERLSLQRSTVRNSGPSDYDVSMTCSARYTGPGGTP